MRQGQLSTDTFMWMAMVFAIIFVVLASIIFGIQAETGVPIDFLSPNPGTGNRITVETSTQETVRSNSILAGGLLTANATPDMTVREAIQRKLYCEVSGSNPPSTGCGFTSSDFDSVVERYFPDVKYRVTVTYQGEQLEADRYASRAFSSGPTVYQVYIAMPGGTNAEMTIRIDGPQTLVRWTK